MRLTVLALTAVPDTDTARQLHRLDDLDDAAVAKILFHRRKQETGHTERLRLVQQRIASLSLLTHADGRTDIKTMTVPEHAEDEALTSCFGCLKGGGRLVTWGGTSHAIPLLRLRAMRHGLRARSFWRTLAATPEAHLDLRATLLPAAETGPADLHDLASLLGLPGLLDTDARDPWELRLAGDFQGLRARGEIEVLNLLLLALRHWTLEGGMSRNAVARLQAGLREALRQQQAPHLRRFLDAWTAT